MIFAYMVTDIALTIWVCLFALKTSAEWFDLSNNDRWIAIGLILITLARHLKVDKGV